MSIQFQTYKKGEGKNVRLGAFVFLALLIVFGCYSLYQSVSAGWWKQPFLGFTSVGEFGLRNGLAISSILFILGLLTTYLLVVNQPRVADFLIETEEEVHKVSKPSRREYLGGSSAVLTIVVVLGVFLAVADWILVWVLNFL